VVSGAQTFFETDFRLRGEHVPVSWTRHYDSRRNHDDRGVGYGFRLSLDVELRFDLDGITFVDGRGRNIEFPFPPDDGQRLLRGGHVLERVNLYHYRVHPPGGKPSWDFHFERETVARPSALFFEQDPRPPVKLSYDKGLLTAMQVDASRRVVFEYMGTHVAGAVLLESGSTSKHRLVRYRYDDKARLVEAEDAYGGVLRYEYDQH
jgi:YD repeat-containing protein